MWSSLRSLSLGNHRLLCPACSHKRLGANRRVQCLAVKVEQELILFKCHHCGEEGFIKRIEEQVQVKITVKDESCGPYLAKRGISQDTWKKFGVFGTKAYIREVETVTDCVAFPYYDLTKLGYAAKVRAVSTKGFASVGSPADLWGIHLVPPGEQLVITEGEIDALSLAEAGVANPTSFPQGATKLRQREDSLGFLWKAKALIDNASKIILATDHDEVGEAYAEEVARRIGKYRVWKVLWPEGIKDANDALLRLGKEALAKLVQDAIPWPVSGLYDAKHFYNEVQDVHDNGLKRGASTGYQTLDDLYTVETGQMTIVTGNPSMGKSELVDQIMTNIARTEGWKFAICSFENPPRLHIPKLMSKQLGKSFWGNTIPKEEFDEAYNWVQDHFVFLYNANGDMADLGSILDRLRAAVMRYGIKGAVIDPYNYISRDKTDGETDWISDLLTRVKTFAVGHDVHIWFVAHPTKPPKGTMPVPGGYDISGSAAWFAKADCGLTVHRPVATEPISEVHIWKVRFPWIGKQGQTLLLYDAASTSYSEGFDMSEWSPTEITATASSMMAVA